MYAGIDIPFSLVASTCLLKVPHVLVELEAGVAAGVLLKWWVNAYHIKLRPQAGQVVC